MLLFPKIIDLEGGKLKHIGDDKTGLFNGSSIAFFDYYQLDNPYALQLCVYPLEIEAQLPVVPILGYCKACGNVLGTLM